MHSFLAAWEGFFAGAKGSSSGLGWGGVGAECHPPSPQDMEKKKHFVSSGFTAITSERQDDRTSLHCSGEAEGKEPRLQKLNRGTHPLLSSLITSPRHGYKQH